MADTASSKRVICITGATSGIGKATAERFARDGWNVIATGRRRERLDDLAAALGPCCLPLVLDVTDRDAVARAFADLPGAFQPVDVLVNNAGLGLGLERVTSASDALVDDWETMIDVNIKGLLYCTRAFAAGMAARGSGHIVNIGSISAYTAYVGGNVYGGTKAFVGQFSRNLRTDLHGTGVRVTNIEPGLLETEFSVVRFRGDKDAADALYRGAEPLVAEDIADIIAYVVNAPKHVNIGRVQVTPTCQSETGMLVHKG